MAVTLKARKPRKRRATRVYVVTRGSRFDAGKVMGVFGSPKTAKEAVLALPRHFSGRWKRSGALPRHFWGRWKISGTTRGKRKAWRNGCDFAEITEWMV